MTLSDKIISCPEEYIEDIISVKDVKEFIKELKERMKDVNNPARYGTFEDIIDKLIGDVLLVNSAQGVKNGN